MTTHSPRGYAPGVGSPTPSSRDWGGSLGVSSRRRASWWHGVFADHHTDDVLVDWKGQAPTHGIDQHIEAMKAYVESAGGTPPQITSHPIKFGSGEWTCVVGEFEGGGRMVTVAKWRDGAICEEYIWA